MTDDGVRLVKSNKQYLGGQGVTYNAGVSRNTAGAEKVCMNVLPMPAGVRAKKFISMRILKLLPTFLKVNVRSFMAKI